MTAVRAAALAVALAAAAIPSAAEVPRAGGIGTIGAWAPSFYAAGPAVPSLPSRALPPEAACVDAILEAEREAGLPDHTLLAMGFTEAGRRTPERLFTVWPWTVNTEGRSSYFASRDEAIAFVREAQARGVRSIDVGCLQVNLRWHPDAFPDLQTAFDPRANTRYAASFLAELRRSAGGLEAAVARYHSAQSDLGAAYRERVAGNLRWVGDAIAYVRALAATPAWGQADVGRLAFLLSVYADGGGRAPALPERSRTCAPGGNGAPGGGFFQTGTACR